MHLLPAFLHPLKTSTDMLFRSRLKMATNALTLLQREVDSAVPSAWIWAWAVAALTNRTQLSWCYARSRAPAPRHQQLPPLLSGAAPSRGFKRSWKKPSTPEVTTLETTRVGTIVGSPNRAQHSSHPHGWHQTCEWRSLSGMDVPAPGDATLFSD